LILSGSKITQDSSKILTNYSGRKLSKAFNQSQQILLNNIMEGSFTRATMRMSPNS